MLFSVLCHKVSEQDIYLFLCLFVGLFGFAFMVLSLYHWQIGC